MSLHGALTDLRMLLSHLYLAPGGSPAWCFTRVCRMVIDLVLVDEKRLVDSRIT